MPLREMLYKRSVNASAKDVESLRNRIYQAIVERTDWRPEHAHSKGVRAFPYPSDHELLKDFIDGDSSAFDALAKKHLPKLLSYARRRVPDFDAGEIVHDAFLVLIRRAQDVVRDGKPISGFLRKTADNLILTYWRKRLNDTLPLDDDLLSDNTAADIIDSILRQENIAHVAEAVETTCNALEEQVILYTLDGYEPAEIGQALDLPVNRVRVAKSRALKKLRVELQKPGGAS
ncbi:MAG: sigma-70 family RNA polymerase sigma factor [Pseudomonadota bacterium]